VAAALLLPSLVGCRSTDVSSATLYVLAATFGRYDIQASLDRPATIQSRDDHALISFAHHQLRVEEGRVVLDDNETAAFPSTATQIVIEVAGGTLRMTADGQEMWKKSFPGE
jgi:hypothetical protein